MRRQNHALFILRRTSGRFVHTFVLPLYLTPTRGRTPMEASLARAIAATFPTPLGPDEPGRIYALPKDGPCEDRKYCDT